MNDLVGRNLAGRYDVLALLGQGGMGTVYRVLDRELDETVALKVIRSDLADNAEIIERFRAEVRLARRVTHANVARTFELGRADGALFCTMELVEGESLAMLLRRRGVISLAEAAAIGLAVCDALIAAHAANVIHRDIKPQNILIAESGRVVVTDFGIASVVVGDAGREGTPPYMAPEQILGEEAPTPAVDVYALGVVLCEMLTGACPFRGDVHAIYTAKRTLEHVAADVPAEVAAVIARATARDVAARIPTAGALRRELARWASAEVRVQPIATSAVPKHAAIVVAPARGDSERLYIAEAVHSELLQRLARTPWVRVETSTATAPAASVELAAGDDLAISITHGDAPPLVLRAPLAVEHITAVAESITAAVIAAIAPPAEPLPALDLVLRARHDAQTNVGRLASGVDLLQEAARIAPASPLVAATLAIAKLQRAFFASQDDVAVLDDAARLVRSALDSAPELFETHMAAGHLELHRGDPALAAVHFRAAIARAPHSAEAHEQLGRMLCEAGHVDRGFARLADALAIAPDRLSARWEIARTRTLLGDWTDHDRLVLEQGVGNILARLRFVTWRGIDYARKLRTIPFPSEMFEGQALVAIFDVICDGAWREHRDRLVSLALESQRPSRRRRAFVAQLVAETAAIAGDGDTCETLIAYAIEHGLFDLLWIDHCSVLGVARERPRFPHLRGLVEQRSAAILDALYGDHVPGALDATALA